MLQSGVGSPLKKTVVIPAVRAPQHYWFTAALSAETTVLSEYTTPAVTKREEDEPLVASQRDHIIERENCLHQKTTDNQKVECNCKCFFTYF